MHKSLTLLGRWAGRNRWQERIRAWDAAQAENVRKAHEAKAKEKAAEWGRREQAVREEEWQNSQALLAQAHKILALPVVKQVVERDGKTIHLHPVNCSARDVARIFEIASRLARLATNQATEKHEHGVAPGSAPFAIGTVVLDLPDNGRDKKAA